jgi:hypothetical protein
MLWITWPIFALLVVVVYLWVGKATTRNRGEDDDYAGSILGILIDDRGRYSLTRLQLSLWTLVVLSLTAGVFAARAATRGIDPLGSRSRRRCSACSASRSARRRSPPR